VPSTFEIISTEGAVPPATEAKNACGELSICSTVFTSAGLGSIFFSPELLQAEMRRTIGRINFFIEELITGFHDFRTSEKKDNEP
jgi:hypothetical protein